MGHTVRELRLPTAQSRQMNKATRSSGYIAVIIVLVQLLLIGASQAQTQVTPEPDSQLSRIAKAYNIKILAAGSTFTVKTTHGAIEGRLANGPELENYIRLFVPEFTLYPAALVKRSRLEMIVLCNDLFFAGQRRSAIPDFEHDTLYIDVSHGSKNKLYLRKVMHHEFFHIIDYRDDGSVYRDERWSRLNAASFHYGNGGRNAQSEKGTGLLTDRFPGFLNHYSTTGVEEDKAEMFAHLICESANVERMANDDAVLRAKIKLMKEILSDLCPQMNDEFWEKSRRLDRPAKFTASVAP